MSVFSFGGYDIRRYERRLSPYLTLITSKVLETMNFVVFDIGRYERSLYPCFLEIMNVLSFGGYDVGRYERRL